MSQRVNVVVIDDHPLYRAGVIQAIEQDALFHVVAEGSSAREAVQLAERCPSGLILLDISLPDRSGIDAAARISALRHPPHILMLTVSGNGTDVMQSIDAGARGYVVKGSGAGDLIAAMRCVSSEEYFISPSVSSSLISSLGRALVAAPEENLTRQEQRILRHVASGLSNREISDMLDICEKTVKFHISNIFRKLKVRNRVRRPASSPLPRIGARHDDRTEPAERTRTQPRNRRPFPRPTTPG